MHTYLHMYIDRHICMYIHIIKYFHTDLLPNKTMSSSLVKIANQLTIQSNLCMYCTYKYIN